MANTYYDSQLTGEQIENALEAINGVIAPANNGKVLAISNGKIIARSVVWPGGSPVIEPLSVTQNGTYTVPSGVDGYSPVTVNVSGGGGGDISIAYYDYAQFDGTSHIELPFTVNADYKITVDFYVDNYVSAQAIIGNSSSTSLPQLVQYNSRWYTGTGSSEANFNMALTGRHTFVNNKDNANYFDNVQVTVYSPQTQNNAVLWVGGRTAGGVNCTSKICNYKIESISNGNTIVNLIPVIISGALEQTGLLDTVSKKIYTSGISSVGNFT